MSVSTLYDNSDVLPVHNGATSGNIVVSSVGGGVARVTERAELHRRANLQPRGRGQL
jgi:hypothetical protein